MLWLSWATSNTRKRHDPYMMENLVDLEHRAGTRLSSTAESVAGFVRCCLEIDGFMAKSHELAAYVYDGFQLCLAPCPPQAMTTKQRNDER